MTLTIGALWPRRRREQPSRIRPRLIVPATTLDGQPNQVVTGRIEGKIAMRTGHDGVEVTMAGSFAKELIANLQHLVDEQT